MPVGKKLVDRESIAIRKNALLKEISSNIDELNKIDAGQWIHVYEVKTCHYYDQQEKYIPKQTLDALNKKLIAAASEILKVTIDLERGLDGD